MSELEYQKLILPNYVNSREVFAGLTVSDMVIAAVLAPLNVMLLGKTGTGKSQLARDIYNHYFGNDVSKGGQGVSIRAHSDIDIYNEIFSRLNKDIASRELTKNIEAILYFVDELNRASPYGQNQFFGLGDGLMDFKGSSIPIGRDGYHLLLATSNPSEN